MFKAEDWKLKYRPTKLDDVILPDNFRRQLEGFKSGKLVQNWLFYGPPGVGKTTCSLLLRDSLYDTHFMNCSIKSSIDDIKKLVDIGSTATMSGNRRLFVIDEVEKLSKEAIQSLRGIIESLSVYNDFILTANDISRLDLAVMSRLNKVNFVVQKDKKLIEQIRKRLEQILALEGVELNEERSCDLNILIDIDCNTNNPLDIRSLIGKLQLLAFDWEQ